jgi:hypothetical protein
MSIKYGELTINHTKEEPDIFTSLSMWFGYERRATKSSDLVFLFEDGEIYIADDKIPDFEFKFIYSIANKMPMYFDKKDKTSTYFYKTPVKKEDKLKLDFIPLFKTYEKYNSSMNIASSSNCIYYCYKSLKKPEVFGIIRLKSNENMPRFQFAYDSNEFTKEEVIYLINYIFTHND